MPWRASPAFARHVQDETTSLLRRARTVAEAQAAIIGNANVALTVERMVMRLREC
jgi:hypothetical protein